MPNKYSHNVVLANYSSRGIINLPSNEQFENLKSLKTPRTLAGTPSPPHQYISTVKSRARAASGSPGHARSSTLQSMSTSPRSSTRQYVIFTGGIPTSQHYRKDEESNCDRLRKTTEATHSPSSERKIILGTGMEEPATGGADSDLWLRDSSSPNGRPPVGSGLSSPFDPCIGCLELNIQRDPFQTETEPAGHADNGILKRDLKLLPPLAARKYETGRDLSRSRDQDNLPSSWPTESLQDGYAEPLLSVREFLASSPRVTPGEGAMHLKRHLISPQANSKHDTMHEASMSQAAEQISKHQTSRWLSLNQPYTSSINLSDDECGGNTHGNTAHTPLAESPCAHTLISEIGVQDSNILNPEEELFDLRDESAFRFVQQTQDEFGKRDPTDVQVRRRPFSLGGGDLQNLRSQKRATLHRRKTEEFIRHSFSHSPVLESQDLSWLLPDVGLNAQTANDYHYEVQTLPRISSQSSESEVCADITSTSLISSVTQAGRLGSKLVEAETPNLSEDHKNNEVCDAIDNAMTKTYAHRLNYESHNEHLPQNEPGFKRSPPSSPRWPSRRGGRPLWSSSSARLASTSVESAGRYQPGLSTTRFNTAVPEAQPETYSGAEGSAPSGEPKFKPNLKSEEEISMRISTPIPHPSPPVISHKRSGRRMVKSRSGSVYTTSRPATMPVFGTPSIVRYDDQTTCIDEQSLSRPNWRRRSSTLQNQKVERGILRKLASFSRFPEMGSDLRHDKEAVPARTAEVYQQDSDNWALPHNPFSKEAASRTSLLGSLVAGVEAELKPSLIALELQHEHPSDLSRQSEQMTAQTGHGREIDDIISLFSNDHDISIDVQNNYASGLHIAGEETEDPDAALPPPDISRYRPDRTSSRHGQYRHSQSSLTALPRMASANTNANRRSRAEKYDVGESMFWALNASPAPPPPAPVDARKANEEKRARMRAGMKALWERLKRRMQR